MLSYSKKGIVVEEIFLSQLDSKDFTKSAHILNIKENDIQKDVLDKNNIFEIPNYLTYMQESSNFDDVLANLEKSKRKKIVKFKKNFEKDYEFVFQEQVSQKDYEEWYENVYSKSINNKDKGVIWAKKDWWANTEKQKLALFVKQKGSICAGIVGIFFKFKSNDKGRFSISYSGILRNSTSTGLGEFINVLLIDKLKSMSCEIITRGRDMNFYGWHLNLGLPVFKKSLGFEISDFQKYGKSFIKINNLTDFQDVCLFFSYKQDELVANYIIKKLEDKEEVIKKYKKLKQPFFIYHFKKDLKLVYSSGL